MTRTPTDESPTAHLDKGHAVWTQPHCQTSTTAARPPPQLHTGSASSAHAWAPSCGGLPDLWPLSLSFLQGLTSSNLGFCERAKGGSIGGKSL